MASLGIGKGTPGAHWKPGGITRQVTGAAPLKPGEGLYSKIMQTSRPLSNEFTTAQAMHGLQKMGVQPEKLMQPQYDPELLRRRMMRQF